MTSLSRRLRTELRYAATMLRVGAPTVLHAPPHRYLSVLGAFARGGSVAAATAFTAAAHGDRIAFVDDRGSITFRDFDADSTALAAALAGRGVRSSDGIGLLCRNHREFFLAFFAAGKLGARTVLLNTEFSAPQLRDVCAREGVTALIHDEEFAAATEFDGIRIAVENLDAEIVSGRGRPLPRPTEPQRVVLLTSGTTGTPKGAPRDAVATLAAPGSYLSRIPLRAARSVFVAAPVFHAWGMGSAMMAYGLGNTVIVQRRFDAIATLDALERHRCDALITVPVLLSRVLDAGDDEIRHRDLSQLRIVAMSGSALSADLATRAMDQLGDVVYNLYGSTEVGYAAIATPADLRAAPGTVGRPPYGTIVKLLDARGREVPRGQIGRIFVDNGIAFDGYTGGGSKEIVGGMMSSGDMGRFDAAGRLFVEGRDDDMIVSGGENVFPREVEELLTARPDVADAAVIGVPDDEFGQRLRAYVVPASAATLDDAELRAHVKANLARYKVPRDIVFVEAIPRNAAGKIVKRDLPS